MEILNTENNKRPVNTVAIVIAALVGMLLHLLQPVYGLCRCIKRANIQGRISYSRNRIYGLECRLRTIDASMQHECRQGANKRPEFIQELAAMKAAAVSELADLQAALQHDTQLLQG